MPRKKNGLWRRRQWRKVRKELALKRARAKFKGQTRSNPR